jgi:MFS transporter, PPP family, 3-phenylpropionic acid transporter
MVPAARLRSVYFLFYAGVGAYLPFFAAYMRGRGFTGEQIGTIQMVPSLLSPFVALGWASWADRRGSPTAGLRRAAIVAALAAAALPFARTPLVVAAVLAVFALGDRAVVPLLDATTLEVARREPRHRYASIRLFGSLGFSAAALAVGWALSARGDIPGDTLVPTVFAVCAAAYACVVLTLPHTAPPAGEARPGLADTLALIRSRSLLTFLLACSVHWAATAPYHLFFGVLVREHGLPSNVAGLAMTAGVVAEILALLVHPRLERRFSPRVLLAVAFAGSALRWMLVSRAESAFALVALQLFHGLTFGLFWATAMSALGVLVPIRLRATGQALFSAIVFGGANALAFQAAGRGYDFHKSAAPLFAWAGALEVLALALTAALSGVNLRARQAPAEQSLS